MTFTGGIIAWMLAVMLIAAFIVFLGRFFELRRAQIDGQDFVGGVINILAAGNPDEALAICEETAAPVANVVASAVRQRKAPARVLREAVDAQGRVESARFERRLASLAILGQIAPSVGLLGTVIGLVKTLVAADTGAIVVRAQLFSGAMEALVSAALGLFVMILVTVMYGMLRIRTDRIVADIEAAASRMIGYIAQAREEQR